MKQARLLWLALLLALLLGACGAGREPAAADPQIPAAPPAGAEEPAKPQIEDEEAAVMQMKIADTAVAVAWEDNDSVAALRELCAGEALEIQMSPYGGFEQVGPLGADLPRDDVQTTTQAGDIVLYAGNQLVVFCGANSWAYTRLGRITDQTAEDMARLLGNGAVTVTLSAETERADGPEP